MPKHNTNSHDLSRRNFLRNSAAALGATGVAGLALSSARALAASSATHPVGLARGDVIDFFSRTGLCIVGIKVLRMSVADAMHF